MDEKGWVDQTECKAHTEGEKKSAKTIAKNEGRKIELEYAHRNVLFSNRRLLHRNEPAKKYD